MVYCQSIAEAEFIEQTQVIPTTRYLGKQDLVFAKFNPSSGILRGVKVEYITIISAFVEGINLSSFSNSFTATLAGDFRLAGPSFSTRPPVSFAGEGFSLGNRPIFIDLGTKTVTGSFDLTTSALNQYVGLDNVTITEDIVLFENFQATRGRSSVNVGFVYDASVVVTVKYNYEPVPEPKAWSLCVGGVVCGILWRITRPGKLKLEQNVKTRHEYNSEI